MPPSAGGREVDAVRILGTILVATAGLLSPEEGFAEQRAYSALTLAQAIQLAGLGAGTLPISLTSHRDPATSAGVEAWTVFGEDGQPVEILVYTESPTFQCANRYPNPNWQCRLKLASVIVHEAWHYRTSRDEEAAYQVQVAFLVQHGASPQVIGGVYRARNQVVARQRQLAEARRKAGFTARVVRE